MSTVGPTDPSAEPASDSPSAGPGPSPAPGSGASPQTPESWRRPARKRFILVGTGTGILIVVLIGLFTNVGSNSGTSGGSGASGSAPGTSGGQPQAGSPVPSFVAQNIGPRGGATVAVSSHGAGRAGPTVLLFFGNWCPSCHQELPPLAAAVKEQRAQAGPLSHIRVVGVDSLDETSSARSFIAGAGVTFPVAYDPSAEVTSGLFYFRGDPYTVFVGANGRIAKIAYGDTLTPEQFTADEQVLIPSGT